MALGFGFNKTKVLASAEKFVQQGKLQNAISEYEKIIKDDPKDVTVLNTIGDLYARVGNNDEAAYYFKKVGDQYAQEGFTVKAIAVYKKLTKLAPGNFENVNKLAELYGQQGLFNDARIQYMVVADHLLKSGDNTQAAKVLQRILELDPENTATQSRLADLYTKLGKKDEARNIYYSAAETLHARGNYEAASEALNKVLKLDPENGQALALRGLIAADSDDYASAVEHLSHVPDLDSRPDGLRALLRAKLYAGNAEGVDAIANKLLNVHNDPVGITTLADWHLSSNQVSSALKLYDQHADRFLSSGRAAFLEMLYPLIARIKDNPEALSTMLRLLQRAGDSSRSAEVMELQANAYAAKADFKPARDLYLRLSEMEPENASHTQNYKQMLSKLGEDAATRNLTPQEAAQAFMVEELDEGAAVVHQSYDPPTEQALEAALTDAELFVSYNVPSKAIPPLEAVLHLAPRDITLHQRLAVLYARGERYADAARMCQILSDIYRDEGYEKDSLRYQEAARKYALRAPSGPPAVTPAAPPRPKPVAPPPVSHAAPEPSVTPEQPSEEAASSVQEFTFDVPDHLLLEPEPAPTPVKTEEPVAIASGPAVEEASVIQPGVAAHESVAREPESEKADEWEDMVSVEAETPPPPPPPHLPETRPEPVAVREEAPVAVPPAQDPAAEKIQDIRFYISQEMWEAAKKAILDLTELAPDAPEITELISAVSSGQSRASRATAATPVTPMEPVQEIPVHVELEPEPEAASAPEMPVAKFEPEPAAVPEFAIETQTIAPPAAEPIAEIPVPIAPEPPPPPPPPVKIAPPKEVEVEIEVPPVIEEPAPPKPVKPAAAKSVPAPPAKPVVPPPVAEPAAAKPVIPPPAPKPAVPPPIAKPAAPPAMAESPLEDILSLAPEPEVAPPAPAMEAPPVAEKKKRAAKVGSTEQILTEFVHDLEEHELVDFVPKAKAEPAPPKSTAPTPATVPAAVAAPAIASRATTNGDMQDAEASSVLNDILAELQEENADEPQAEEDPETHYNLGIAFKEMGLLDEAIGELQKVCHSLDRGSNFSQPIQAYTWLAQCLVDKGAPEAAVRWYQRALQLPRLDDDSRCAIYYDLAMAYEATGDKKLALANFMEVYGSNIDFRDVASRIKALKS